MRGEAYGQVQYVDVDFPTANVDVRIGHFLKAVPFTEVYYTVVKKNIAGDIYTGTLSLWEPQVIALKSDTSGMSVTLLLFTRNN